MGKNLFVGDRRNVIAQKMADRPKDIGNDDTIFRNNLIFQVDGSTKNIRDLVFNCRAIFIDEIF